VKKILFFLLAMFAVTDVNAADISLAQKAIVSGNFEQLGSLLEQGLDANAADENGDPLLFYALTSTSDLKMAQKLIDAGADVNKPSFSGLTPLLLASAVGPALEEQNSVRNLRFTDYGKFQLSHAEAITKLLINAGADVNQETPYGTPLMKAATSELNVDIIILLLKAGADVNQKDRHGRTALFYASAFGCDNVITLLLKAGADITILDEDRMSYMDADKNIFEAE